MKKIKDFINFIVDIYLKIRSKSYSKITILILSGLFAIYSTPLILELLSFLMGEQNSSTPNEKIDNNFIIVLSITLIYYIIMYYLDSIIYQKIKDKNLEKMNNIDKQLYFEFLKDFPSNGKIISFLNLHDKLFLYSFYYPTFINLEVLSNLQYYH